MNKWQGGIWHSGATGRNSIGIVSPAYSGKNSRDEFPASILTFCSNWNRKSNFNFWKYQKHKQSWHHRWNNSWILSMRHRLKKKKTFGGEAKLHWWSVCQIQWTNHVSLLDESLSAFLLLLVAMQRCPVTSQHVAPNQPMQTCQSDF